MMLSDLDTFAIGICMAFACIQLLRIARALEKIGRGEGK